MANRIPTHPGAVLRDIAFPALKKPVTEIARELGLSRQQLHAIMREEAPVTPETALRLGKYLGNGPSLWLNMQSRHDLAKLQASLAAELEKIPTVEAVE